MRNARWIRTARVSALAVTFAVALIACGRGGSEQPASSSANTGHADGAAEPEHREDEPSTVELSPEAMKRAGIVVEEVRQVSGEQVLLAPAELQPNADRIAKVGPRVSGRIQRVIATLGANVRAGQALATIWSPEAAEATAGLDSARAAERLARRSLERERDLFERRVAAQREVLEAEAAHAKAEAEVRAAEARLAAMGFSSRDGSKGRRDAVVTLTSPIGGTVIDRTASVDAPVGPDSVLFTIADLNTLWLTVRVPETSAAAIRRGQSVSVNVGALPERPVQGRIDYVAPIISPDTRTVDVRVEVPNRDRELRPGMSATARFDLPDRVPSTGTEQRVLVPRAAVQELNGATVVFVPGGDRQFTPRPVTIGAAYGSDVEVVSGIDPGDRIVVKGAFTLKSQAVRGAGGDHHH